MAIPWIGSRSIAIVPVWNQAVDDQPAEDFGYTVASRIFYDPQNGVDDSLQNYVQAVSYGQAWIAGKVFPVVASADADVTGAAMDSLPEGHGYTHLIAVLPHALGPHRGAWAWWDVSPRNGVTAFARVALFEDRNQNRRQSVGVWAMETLHAVTEFGDLYNVEPDLGSYDVMADASSASHPSTHTKLAMGWVQPTDVVRQQRGTRQHVLHALGLRNPPPPGRVTAVRIPARSHAGSFVVEARLAVDQYEGRDAPGSGIPAEGVIVYEVASLLDVRLRTDRVLEVGDTYSNTSEGFSVTVTGALPGGRQISVTRTEDAQCSRLRREIIRIQEEIFETHNPDELKQLRRTLSRLRQQATSVGCDLA